MYVSIPPYWWPSQTALGKNLGLCGKNPATKCLSYDMASTYPDQSFKWTLFLNVNAGNLKLLLFLPYSIPF